MSLYQRQKCQTKPCRPVPKVLDNYQTSKKPLKSSLARSRKRTHNNNCTNILIYVPIEKVSLIQVVSTSLTSTVVLLSGGTIASSNNIRIIIVCVRRFHIDASLEPKCTYKLCNSRLQLYVQYTLRPIYNRLVGLRSNGYLTIAENNPNPLLHTKGLSSLFS